MTTYDATVGKFAETDSNNWVPFNFVSAAAFQQKADLTVAGLTQDCGECHVGGGANEYIPWTAAGMDNRTSLRNIADPLVQINGSAVPNPITAAQYTAFNYLIDTYDVDGDGDKAEALHLDYTKTGVAEMDCMMCHQEGYSWDNRLTQVRALKHDAARAVGAGIATPNAMLPAAYGTDGWGTTVGAYDMTKVVAVGGVLKLSPTFADNIKKLPPTANCNSCHMGDGFGIAEEGRRMVDFKKRGDHWVENNINWDVHSSALDCMDCHANSGTALYTNGVQPAGAFGVDVATGFTGAAYGTGTDAVNNTTGAAGADGFVDASGVPVAMTGAGASLRGQCDPRKGSSNFESVWNAKETVATNLTCAECHNAAGTPKNPDGTKKYAGAQDPTAAHAAAGLTDLKLQAVGTTTGVATKSHIDMIECNTCHIRKLEHYSGGMIDATGKDHAGRLADHENQYIEKDMYDNLIHVWYDGKLSKANNNLTMFWADKNDATRDANNDGRAFGLDALLTTHVNNINNANSWTNMSYDNHGVITPAVISARQDVFKTALDGQLGTTGDPIIPKLVIMGVPFNVDHGTSPKGKAWGAGGCKDCHAPTSAFFSGQSPVKPPGLTMTWNAGQVVPYTKVNSGAQKTTYHPAVVTKRGDRSLAIDLSASGSLTSVENSKFMYEDTFRKKNTAWSADAGVITGATIAAGTFASTYNATTGVAGTTKGLFMHVEVADAVTFANAKRITLQCANEVADAAGLLAAMDSATRANGNLASGGYGFTVTAPAGNLVLTANSGKVIRVVPSTQQADDGAILGFDNAIYVADPMVGTLGGSYATRTEWVNYLNTIGVATAAPITAPAVSPANVVKGVAMAFSGNTAGLNPGNKYKWDMGNGVTFEGVGPAAASISYAYPVEGTYTAKLFVTAPAGGTPASSAVTVKVAAVAAPGWNATLNLATTPDQLELVDLPPTTTKVYVVWDDGLKTNQAIAAGTLAVNIPHTYKKVAQRWNGSNFVYNTVVRVYDAGGVLLGTKSVPVTIAP